MKTGVRCCVMPPTIWGSDGLVQHVRRCMGMWISNGLHHLWCEAGQCYVVSEAGACTFCGCAGVQKYHLLTREWANCEQLHVNRENIP